MWKLLLLVTALQTVCLAQEINVTVFGRLVATGGTGCTTTGGQADHVVEPVDVVLGPSGDVLILDRACSRVTQAATTGGATDGGLVVAGGTVGSFLNALQDPEALVYDDVSGEIYVADTSNHRVMRWQLGGATGTELITSGPATARGKVRTPTGVALSDSGAGAAATLYVVEGNLRVQYFELASCCSDPTQAVGEVGMGCVPEDIPCFATDSYAVTACRPWSHCLCR